MGWLRCLHSCQPCMTAKYCLHLAPKGQACSGLVEQILNLPPYVHCGAHCAAAAPMFVQASYGAGLAVLTTDMADICNNFFAHNTALQAGGGLWCSNQAEDTSGTSYGLTNNTWLNNTALIRGGGIVASPCNVTVHGDKFLGNRAGQEGGGVMVHGGQAVSLQRMQVGWQHSTCRLHAGQVQRIQQPKQRPTTFK